MGAPVMMVPLAVEQEAMQVDAATNRLSQPLLHISQLLARPRLDQLEEKKWPALATLVVPSQLVVVSVPTLQRQTGRQVLSQSSCPRIRQLHPDLQLWSIPGLLSKGNQPLASSIQLCMRMEAPSMTLWQETTNAPQEVQMAQHVARRASMQLRVGMLQLDGAALSLPNLPRCSGLPVLWSDRVQSVDMF